MINPAVKHRTIHIDIRHHYIQEQYEEKVVEPFHVAGEENPADLFTKSLPVIKVENFRSHLYALKLDFTSSYHISGSDVIGLYVFFELELPYVSDHFLFPMLT